MEVTLTTNPSPRCLMAGTKLWMRASGLQKFVSKTSLASSRSAAIHCAPARPMPALLTSPSTSPRAFYGAPRQFRGLTTAREIRDESDRAASTLGFDSLRELIETIPAPCRHGQNGAFFRKGDGHRIADPARRAGDEQSLSSQFHPLLPPQMRSWRPITFSRCAMSFSVDSRNSFIGPKGDAVAW